MMPPDLNADLHFWRMWRDIGSGVVVLGVVVEGVIDIFWPHEPSIITWDTRTRWQKFRAWWTLRNSATIGALIIVAIGLGMEALFGDWADDKADRIVDNAIVEQTRVE